MNQKKNPYVSLVALLLLALILVFICTGCTDAEASEPAPAETEAETPDRFTIAKEYHAGVYIGIITDTATGKEYTVAWTSGGGMTKLEG